MALALSLTAGATVSFFFLRLARQRAFEIDLGAGERRAFKGGTLNLPLVFASQRNEQTANVQLLDVPEGVQAALLPGGDHHLSLSISSKFSGVFSGFTLKIGVFDPLGLFARYEARRLDLAAEFLPYSLLTSRGEISVMATMLGDRPAGSRGSGQEFYNAELYDSAHDSKGILWKRLAAGEGDNLMVRVGEANIPDTLTVCFLESLPRPPRTLPGWMDLGSEAVSLIGLTILGTRSKLRLVHRVGKDTTVSEASDLKGLADLVAWLWRADPLKEKTQESPEDAGIIVTGEAELQDSTTFGLLSKKPTVVLSYVSGRPTQGTGVVFFTGNENISSLVYRVMSR